MFSFSVDAHKLQFVGPVNVSAANGIYEPRGAEYGSPVVELRSSVTPGKMKKIFWNPVRGGIMRGFNIYAIY